MKTYTLTKKILFNMPVKEVNYTINPTNNKELKNPKTIIIHDTKTLNTLDKVYKNFIKKKNEPSIGYHIMIGKNGQYYITRNLNIEGYHTTYLNSKTFGIALFGDFNKKEPTKKQLDSLQKICQIIKENYNIKTTLPHNEAIYEIIKEKSKSKLPNLNSEAIENDISYYSFLKKISNIIKKEKSDELMTIFNEMKTCPGIYLQQKIKELKI